MDEAGANTIRTSPHFAQLNWFAYGMCFEDEGGEGGAAGEVRPVGSGLDAADISSRNP
jgi:hypothetical protein